MVSLKIITLNDNSLVLCGWRDMKIVAPTSAIKQTVEITIQVSEVEIRKIILKAAVATAVKKYWLCYKYEIKINPVLSYRLSLERKPQLEF